MGANIYSFIEVKVKEIFQIEIDKIKSPGLQPAPVPPYDNNLCALKLESKQLQKR